MTRCPYCSRPGDLCVCAHLDPVHTRTGITILQHPGERNHAFNTARLAKRVIADCSLHIAWPDAHGRMQVDVELPEGTALLYPSPDAVLLSPEHAPKHLVVLDGTWSQVRRLLADNPWCAALPTVSLQPAAPSRYRIREEPAAHCLSTIEAIALSLEAIEPDTLGRERILAGFDAMVDGHLAQARAPHGRYRSRSRPSLLEQLAAGEGVVVYAEAVGLREAGAPRMLQWTALRLDTGACFDAVVQPSEEVPAAVLSQMGLDLSGAESLQSVRERWQAFIGPRPLLGFAWSGQTRRIAEAAGLGLKVHSLKALAGQQGHSEKGLSRLLAQQNWGSTPRLVRGRASQRLGNAMAVAQGLVAQPGS